MQQGRGRGVAQGRRLLPPGMLEVWTAGLATASLCSLAASDLGTQGVLEEGGSRGEC